MGLILNWNFSKHVLRNISLTSISWDCSRKYMMSFHEGSHQHLWGKRKNIGLEHNVSYSSLQFSSVHSLSHVRFFATPWITACQASLSITNSRRTLRLTSIELVMPSSHLILFHPLFLLLQIPPSIRLFSNESTLLMRWPKYWSFSFTSFLPKNTQGWSPLAWTGWISLQSKGLSRVFSNTTVQKHQFFGAQPSSQSNSHIHRWPLEKP